MAVRTTRLAVGNSLPANNDHIIYTCPVEETTILKDIRLSTQGVAAPQVVVRVTSGLHSVWLTEGAMNAFSTRVVECWVVLRPGDRVIIYGDTGAVSYWLSGTQLEGLAD